MEKGKKFNKKRFTVKYKLISVFMILLLIPTSLIGLLSYQKAKGELERQYIRSASESVDVISNMVTNTVEPKMENVTVFSEEINAELYQGLKSPKIRSLFEDYMKFHKDLDSVYVGTESGVMIQTPQKELGADYDPRERPWYQKAMEHKGEVIITDPYVSKASGNLVIAVAKTTSDGTGVIGMDIKLDDLLTLTEEVNVGKKGYAMILDQSKNIVVHPTEKMGEQASESFFEPMYESAKGNFEFDYQGQSKRMQFETNNITGWKIGGVISKSEIKEISQPILTRTIIVLIPSILLGGVLIFFIIFSITKPLITLRNSAIKISKGNLTEKISINNKDEIGDLAISFNDMTRDLQTLIHDVSTKSESVAASSEELMASSDQTTTASEYVATSLEEVAGRAESQNKYLSAIAEALKDINRNVESVAGNTVIVSELTNHAVEHAEEGSRLVQSNQQQMNEIYLAVEKSNQNMHELQEKSKEIGAIVELISGIANQTRLLALNASIEAARAGEAGKGFAVVAEEVGKLAKETEKSSEQIVTIIRDIVKDTDITVEGMEKATETVTSGILISNHTAEKLEGIIQSIVEISPQVREVETITKQIASKTEHVNESLSELVATAQDNASITEEMAGSTEEQLASMEEIKAASTSLALLAEELQLLIQKFEIK